MPEKRARSALARLARTLPWRRPSASYEEVERAEQTFYIRQLRPGMVVFDVGANVGELSLLFSRFVGPSGRVHAFEASAKVFANLIRVLEATQRRNVVANHLAVCDRPGEVVLHCYDAAFSAFNSMADRPLAAYGVQAGERALERVPAATLDSYCRKYEISRIDLLKVDVEGAELQVLQGAAHMLGERRIACLTLEFGQTTFDMGNRPEQIADLLRRAGYRLSNIVGRDPLFPGGSDVRTARFAMLVARPR